jgi:aspartyl-tRNA(Asn)/glutamyl-tRNA(Gln) amidotransferase subunit A
MTIRQLRAQLDRGEITSRALTETVLARIADPNGEGSRTFTAVFATEARAAADAADTQRRAGFVASPLAGIPISIKDLFDVAGTTTHAGSTILHGHPPAARDAVIVERLRRAGAVIVGKTNMTEFAYTGLGINPHFDTPRNPYDRAAARIPGGSSSGAAVSVGDEMAAAAIGTDTGGSVRIPAALCGLTGFKPTARGVPLAGTYPLSMSLDSIGPLAACVQDCAIVDAILAGDEEPSYEPPPVARLRFLAPTNYVREELDPPVAAAFERALNALRAAGATIEEAPLAPLDAVPALQSNGGLPAAEAYWWHRRYLDTEGSRYDPHVYRRIMRGQALTAADYVDLIVGRRDLIARMLRATEGYDGLLVPTVAIVAPRIADLADDDVYGRTNLLVLRNTSVVNVIDGCALSLPIQGPGEAPVGLMLVGGGGADAPVLRAGFALERALARAG